MESIDHNPIVKVSSALPLTHPSVIQAVLRHQAALEFRAHDGVPGSVDDLLAPSNRAHRLTLARAIAHAAQALRTEDGLSGDVINLVHEANRLIARRPMPPRRRKVAIPRIAAYLGRFHADPQQFSQAEMLAPNLRLRIDFRACNTDDPYPDVLTFPDNLIQAFEPESATPPTAAAATATPPSEPPASATSKGPGSAGSLIPGVLRSLPAKAAAVASALLMVVFLQPPIGDRAAIPGGPAPLPAAIQSQKVSPAANCSFEQNRTQLGDGLQPPVPLPARNSSLLLGDGFA
ncbi:MAG: hypothetical protein ACRD22_07880, partial [Terriglobia bacterium]